jgi:hypothetical protein
LKEEFILDFLERSGLLVLRDHRYFTTALGELTVKLYLKPVTALWIKSRLPVITTAPAFIDSVVRSLQLESESVKTVGLSQSLGLLVEKSDSSLVEAARKGKVEIGDLETLLQTVIWLGRSIITVGQLSGNDEVAIIGESIVAAWERHTG